MAGSADNDLVILVDADDVQVGTAGKLDAHQRGLRHRAISVLVRSAAGQFLLQRRSPAKYHSGGLWTNACCSHPLPGESTADPFGVDKFQGQIAAGTSVPHATPKPSARTTASIKTVQAPAHATPTPVKPVSVTPATPPPFGFGLFRKPFKVP